MHIDDVRDILRDPSVDRDRRLLRLQGLRGDDVEQAISSGWAMRIAPAQCAVLSILAFGLSETGVYLLLAALALIGVVSSHHPVEWLYVWWSRRQGRPALPVNRAARRFAFLAATTFYSVAALGLAFGIPVLSTVAGLIMIVVPTIVTVTGVWIPAIVFTVLCGAARAARPSLTAALRGFALPAERLSAELGLDLFASAPAWSAAENI